jgi:hypothetical protein
VDAKKLEQFVGQFVIDLGAWTYLATSFDVGLWRAVCLR